MFATCSRSLASRLLRGLPCLLAACRGACSRACATWLATDISGLLLLQKDMRDGQEAEREQRQDQRIEPEIGIAEPFGEGADADRLKPGRWKHQTDHPSLAGKGGDRHQQARKVDRGNNGDDGGRKNCCDLGLSE